jgi:uncharacterized protein Yka (UPF0111/DUF47 family)
VGLLPKDESFWPFFTRQTAALCLGSDLLSKGAREGNSRLAGVAVRVKALERESSRTLHELQVKLHKTFVTPIDPEDISLLFELLDHLLDQLEALTYRMTAYHLEPVPPPMADLADRIHASAELLEKAFGLLSITESTEELCHRFMLRRNKPTKPYVKQSPACSPLRRTRLRC